MIACWLNERQACQARLFYIDSIHHDTADCPEIVIDCRAMPDQCFGDLDWHLDHVAIVEVNLLPFIDGGCPHPHEREHPKHMREVVVGNNPMN